MTLNETLDRSMQVRKSLAFAAFAAVIGCTVGCTLPPKPLIVSCKSESDQVDVVNLDLARSQATLLSVSPPLSGTVQISPTEFDILFQPGPDQMPRLRLRINRYTFRVIREAGEPATGAPAASSYAGLCERYKAKPL